MRERGWWHGEEGVDSAQVGQRMEVDARLEGAWVGRLERLRLLGV